MHIALSFNPKAMGEGQQDQIFEAKSPNLRWSCGADTIPLSPLAERRGAKGLCPANDLPKGHKKDNYILPDIYRHVYEV